ncbi:hypothetical protein StoSoilB22_31520 [Arthrobacter sp. StoSoilB22]|nr:hypothetical protein StoSoilB22_31520 [Arthrobacter sp. StoSoilB22]
MGVTDSTGTTASEGLATGLFAGGVPGLGAQDTSEATVKARIHTWALYFLSAPEIRITVHPEISHP